MATRPLSLGQEVNCTKLKRCLLFFSLSSALSRVKVKQHEWCSVTLPCANLFCAIALVFWFLIMCQPFKNYSMCLSWTLECLREKKGCELNSRWLRDDLNDCLSRNLYCFIYGKIVQKDFFSFLLMFLSASDFNTRTLLSLPLLKAHVFHSTFRTNQSLLNNIEEKGERKREKHFCKIQ